METITLNRKQQRRAEILAKLSNGGMSKDDAAQLLGVTRRQIDRLLKDYKRRGLASVVHGNTGKTPANKTKYEVEEEVVSFTEKGGKYEGFNICHLHDLLEKMKK